MSYITEASPVAVDLAAIGIGTDTALKLIPAFAVGTKVKCNDGVYQYCKSVATLAIGDLVKISNTFTLTGVTTTTNPSTEPAKCGVVVGAALITGQYAWIFVGPGLVSVSCAASCVQDVKLYTTGTAGTVDDSSTTLVNGLKLITTITSAAISPCVAECELSTAIA